MYEKYVVSKNGLMYFLLMWSMSICNVICDLCPAVFNGGYVKPSCGRFSGFMCNYYCYPGFDKTRDWLHCGTGGNWLQDTNSVCIKSDHCPLEFYGGYIETSCSRRPGVRCKYNCDSGFVGSGGLLTCMKGGNWVPDTNSLCIKSDLCPAVFNGGYIEPSCSRLSGYSCAFYCNPEFVKNGNWLTCGEDGKWLQDTNSICIKSDLCPAVFNGGYLEPYCSRLPGDSCTFFCNPEFVKNGSRLTYGEDGKWIQDTNSICIESVEQTSSYSKSRRTSEGNVGAIVGITTAALIVIIIIVAIVVCISKRSSVRKSQRRGPGHTGGTCLRPRETRDQNVTTLRQHPNADGIGSVSSFESPSYNGLYVHSFVQRIPTISSSCKYPDPPPSYSETPIAPNESPPDYEEVVTDPSRFNLYI